jgi:hypothetical protein
MIRSGTANSYCQVHWRNSSNIVLVGELLLLVLAAMNMSAGGLDASSAEPVMYAVMAYCAWLICGEFAVFLGRVNRPFIVVRTWVMAALVIWIMWRTDGLSSPLRNGIQLAILVSALSVGRANSFILILLLIVNTLALVHSSTDASVGGAAILGETVTRITPQVIVASLVAMFGTDLRYRLSAWHLDRCRCPSSGLLDQSGLVIELSRFHAELLRSSAPLCALVLTLAADPDGLERKGGRMQKAVSLLAANIFLELRRGDVAARHGSNSILILLSNAVQQDCMDLERKLRDTVDIDFIRRETGLAGLEVRYSRVFRESPPQGIDRMLSAIDAADVRHAS